MPKNVNSPLTLSTWLSHATTQLRKCGVDSPRLDTMLLLAHVTKKTTAHLLAHPEKQLSATQVGKLSALLTRRLDHEPIAYITGHKDFYGYDIAVNEHVLVPRPETEALVTTILKEALPNTHVLEIGAGSGCIAISLKKQRPDLQITATDVSQAALTVAKKNAAQLGADIEFMETFLLEDTPGSDYIVANLPYVPRGLQNKPDIKHEPQMALFSGDDGLDLYRAFIPLLTNRLEKTGSWALIEHLPNQYSAVQKIAHESLLEVGHVSDYVTRITKEQ